MQARFEQSHWHAIFLNMFKFDAGNVKLFITPMIRKRGRGKPSNGGRRELNKQDKLRRIKASARELFIQHGYDDASIREIAHRADVALGTIFSYAADKRDLLFLVVNEELAEVAARGAAVVQADASLLENLVNSLRPVYQFFSEEPKLSRIVLREMQFYELGPQAKKFMMTRDRMLLLIVKSVKIAVETKEIASKQPAEIVGSVIYSIFQVEVRRWLSSRVVKVGDGINQLKRSFSVVLYGLTVSRRN